MPSLLWTGTLSPSMKLLVNTSNIFAWITGNARDTISMKMRMKLGYNAEVTDSVTRYDELGLEHYTKVSQDLLQNIELENKKLLDVGCGTGILSLAALTGGAKTITCGDQSSYMLNMCRDKIKSMGYGEDKVSCRELDAESLPFQDGSFDITVSSMVLGLVPDQEKMIREMSRVTSKKGIVAIATHGTEHYKEATENAFKVVPKRYVFGYRIEYWPRSEKYIRTLLNKAGLNEVRTMRSTWQDNFQTGRDLFEFFMATSSSWWCAKYPRDKISEVTEKTISYLDKKGITQFTQDIIFGYGIKA
ncbi:class I SAM-dependent methyltransferase [Candidatus Omnitrophota bacterium]